MSNTPSDADIVALARSEGIKVRTGAGVVKLARAVLAKWGTPQPSDCTRSHPHEDMSDYCLLRTEIARLANENARLKASQPVVREPLGNKELQAISLEYSDSEDECTGFRDGWRFAEKHYGITKNGGK